MRVIKYSPEMAQARADGRKTQTRRPIKFPKDFFSMEAEGFDQGTDKKWFAWGITIEQNERDQWQEQCHASYDAMECPYGKVGDKLTPVKIHGICQCQILGQDKITGIRIERIQDITNDDARKEGVLSPYDGLSYRPTGNPNAGLAEKFSELWDSFYGDTEFSWDKNCWVWIIDFEVVK